MRGDVRPGDITESWVRTQEVKFPCKVLGGFMPAKLAEVIHFIQRRLDRWVADRARELPFGSRVLDSGAGGSPYRNLFSHCVYKTQDFCQLEPGQLIQGKYAPIDYVSDIATMPIPDESFEAISNTEVLEHVPNPIDALKEMARVLVPGGRLIISAPLGSGLHQEPYHFYGGFTLFFYKRFLSELGFSEIVVKSKGAPTRMLLN